MLGRMIAATALALVALAPAAGVLAAAAAAQDAPTVLEATLTGPVTPVIAEHMRTGVERAADQGHDLFLVRMDTPGGLDTAMRDIVQAFLGSRVPVVVWVAPAGARAASAGCIIGLASHVLAMAPGTNIGAATPVSIEGAEVGDKVVNDAAAYAEAIAQARGRDVRFARETVTEGRSEPAEKALELDVADLVVRTRDALLRDLDGREVRLTGERTVKLSTAGADVVAHDMSWFGRIRQRLADPNIAFLFMSIGSLALLYELANPGIQLGGIVGIILLLLGFFALSVLPVSVVGILLLLLAVGLFVAELFVPGVGVFAAGGTIALVLSGLFLFEGSLGVSLAVILPTAVVVGGAAVLAGRLVWRAHRGVSETGETAMVGREAEVRDAEGSRGRVSIDGTWWNVRSSASLAPGQTVRVTGQEGLTLMVEPTTEEAER